jgi:hypothetical protein
MDPAQSVYHQRMHFVTFDVAELLVSGGSNLLVATLGTAKFGYLNTWCDMSHAGGPDGCRAFILQLRITFADGTNLTHCSSSDSGWEASESPVAWDHFWHGETMNASVSLGGQDNQWRPARLMLNSSGGGETECDDRLMLLLAKHCNDHVGIPSGITTPPMNPIGPLFPTNSPPIRELERLPARSVYEVDHHQPCSGWVGPLQRIYLDPMCPNVGNHPNMSLEVGVFCGCFAEPCSQG